MRGRVRSRRKEEVVEEVSALAANGYKEVVLTGIHLSSYGVDFEEKETLLSLIQAVHAIEGIERIRLGSLEPRIITEEFASALSALPKSVRISSVIAKWLRGDFKADEPKIFSRRIF